MKQKKEPKVALTLIVKNEAKNIIECLNSMTGLYDHAFITDTGSEDDTVALLKKRRDVTVSHFEWIEDFAAARNYNLSQVPDEYDWVVWADADDRVHATEEQRVEFRKRIGYMEAGGFTHADFPYIYSHQGQDIERGVPEFKYHRKRLFKRDACTWKGFIHEHPAVIGKGCKYNEPVWHHYRDGTGRMNTERNLRIFEKKLKEMEGETLARYTFYYAKELTYNQKYDEAIKQFETYLPISNLVPEKARAMYELGVLYRMRGDKEQATHYANECLKIEPNNPDAHVLLSKTFYDDKNYAQAYWHAQRAVLTKDEQMAFFDYIPNRTWVPLELMAWCKFQEGYVGDAIVFIKHAIEYNKNHPHLLATEEKFRKEL